MEFSHIKHLKPELYLGSKGEPGFQSVITPGPKNRGEKMKRKQSERLGHTSKAERSRACPQLGISSLGKSQAVYKGWDISG